MHTQAHRQTRVVHPESFRSNAQNAITFAFVYTQKCKRSFLRTFACVSSRGFNYNAKRVCAQNISTLKRTLGSETFRMYYTCRCMVWHTGAQMKTQVNNGGGGLCKYSCWWCICEKIVQMQDASGRTHKDLRVALFM